MLLQIKKLLFLQYLSCLKKVYNMVFNYVNFLIEFTDSVSLVYMALFEK